MDLIRDLVKQQDFGIHIEDTRNSKALSLTTGKFCSPFANLRVDTVG